METLRTELNSNEKLALSLTGMEGTGEHFILNGEAADQTLLRENKRSLIPQQMSQKINSLNIIRHQRITLNHYLTI